MIRVITLLILAAALALSLSESRAQNNGLPLVKAGACIPLTNPCDKIDCHRVETKRIA